MPIPGEHKTVQARVLEYAEAIGWTVLFREEAEERRAGFPGRQIGDNAGRNARAPLSPRFDDLLDTKVREFNPRYTEAEGALLGQFHHLHTDIYGNREFVAHVRNWGKFFDHEEQRLASRSCTGYSQPIDSGSHHREVNNRYVLAARLGQLANHVSIRWA